ncbi:carbohydrate porin [Mangrovibacter yixingensis]|uniref:carbohydrate porin n=1 Tax=Mangrovibacter yixingensis TaxID=1529639 RepID=UPI001CFED235|nr:carbohydrate porin [Mangrovibacter yixingensis]
MKLLPTKNKLAAGIMLSLVCSGAWAADPFAVDSPWMLGDWGGTRSELHDKGIDFNVNYVMEAATNLDGYQKHTTARYTDQWMFNTHLDLDKLLCWKDTEFQATITDRNGQNLSDNLSDSRTPMLSSVQEVYGRGQTWRLTQLWLKKGFWDDRLDIKVGRATVGEDFGSIETHFQNLALGPGIPGKSRGNYWMNWPVSQWMARAKINFTPEVYFQVGLYNENPYNYDKGDGFRFEFTDSDGNLVPFELGWQPELGPDHLKGNYRLGGYYTSAHGSVYHTWQDGSYSSEAHGYGGYLIIQQQLFAQGHDNHRGLTLTLSNIMNDKRTSKLDNTQTVALAWKGMFESRPKDEIGLGAARLHVNSAYSRMLERENEYNGVSDYNDATYLPVIHGAEYDYELYYSINATNWLTIRPNIQYVAAPGANSAVKNAVVAGLGASLNF